MTIPKVALSVALALMPVAAQADMIDVSSAVTQAVVYPQGARLTRSVKVSVKEGPQTVRFQGVQPNFDQESLSVAGRGSASVRILGAGMKTEFLKESPDARVKELTGAIQVIDDELTAINGERAALEQKKAFLDSVRLFHGTQLPKDLVTKVPSADELKATMTFLEDGTRGYEQAVQAQAIKQRAKTLERNRLANELAQVQSSGNAREKLVLAVDLECEKGGELTLDVSYNVSQVSWYPLYDARVDMEKNKAFISAFAVVQQTSGEDWTDIPLVLSTARPSAGGTMPELSSWFLRPVVAQAYDGMTRRSMAKGAMQMLAAGAPAMEADAGSYSGADNAPAAVAMKDAVTVQAQSSVSGTAMVYKAAHPVTIKSDGSETRVPLTSQALAVAFEYAATPKLSPYAYLKSTVTNGPNDPLLSGRVNAFLDGTYVGASAIGRTIAAGETFDLYLGVDEGVVVKRELLEQKTDETLIGNIPSSSRKVSCKFKIVAENYKPRAVKVNIFDQIPVAQDDRIKVTRVQSSVKPETEKYRDREGIYAWALTLQPKEKQEIILSYTVEYPREMNISGLQ